jgi:hypothetical protein
MEEIKCIYGGNTRKLKHIYKNKNYKLQNVLGYCFICMEDLQKIHHNYLCHDKLYSLCSNCFSKYVNNISDCICSSKIISKNFLYYCETSKININQIIIKYFFKYFFDDDEYYIRKEFSTYHLKKFINSFIENKFDNMVIVLESSPEYETAPRLLQITYNNNFIIDKLIEGTQETIKFKKLEHLKILSILDFLKDEKVTTIDLGKGEDIIFSENYVI